ncbi:hypothetical protein SEA_TARYNEARAL_62 [Mycobacterium phage Tarynearal]|nr:hypothetical protein SEA_TARYNEARAL_62 [Mycobacterium phage Tarynearal]
MVDAIPASLLNGNHIGHIIEFDWLFPASLVKARVSGELREVHHASEGYVDVWLSNTESGAKEEFSIYVGKSVDVHT